MKKATYNSLISLVAIAEESLRRSKKHSTSNDPSEAQLSEFFKSLATSAIREAEMHLDGGK